MHVNGSVISRSACFTHRPTDTSSLKFTQTGLPLSESHAARLRTLRCFRLAETKYAGQFQLCAPHVGWTTAARLRESEKKTGLSKFYLLQDANKLVAFSTALAKGRRRSNYDPNIFCADVHGQFCPEILSTRSK